MNGEKRFLILSLHGRKPLICLIAAFSLAALLLITALKPDAPVMKTALETGAKGRGTGALIVLDAGHGGIDGGAVSVGGIPEKEINLAVAMKVRSVLLLNGFDVIMTRESDASIHDPETENGTIHEKKVSDINNRIAIMRQHPDAILISIHQNTFSDPAVGGAQVFYVKNEESRRLAEILQAKLSVGLDGNGPKSPKEAYDTIKLMNSIENTGVLVECGFLSNPDDEKKLMTDGYREQIARCILDALNEFLNETEREETE